MRRRRLPVPPPPASPPLASPPRALPAYLLPASFRVRRWNFDLNKGGIHLSWFNGGETNVCYNALDRHVKASDGPAAPAAAASTAAAAAAAACRRLKW